MKTRRGVMVIASFLCGALLLGNWPLLSYGQPPPPDPGGCDMQFLAGTAPTIDGNLSTGGANEWSDAGTTASGGCIDALPDGSPANLQNDLPAHAATIYTKRDAANLYLAFKVADATIATPGQAQGSAITIGDRIVLQFDPKQTRQPSPTSADFRLELILYRDAAGNVEPHWYAGTGDVNNPWGEGTVPNGVQSKCMSTADGYTAELQLPLAALAYTLNPNNPADIGIAVAIINDLKAALPGDPTTEAATGTAFPNLPALKVTNANGILLDSADELTVPLGKTAWNSPANWGTAFLAGAGDEILISRSQYPWLSEDIKALFCPVPSSGAPPTNDDFNNAPALNTNGWYRYDNTTDTPRSLYLLTRIRRSGGVISPDNPGVVHKRVLALWAENGGNPMHWTYINLTGPISLPPGQGQPGNQSLAVTGFNWTNVPAKQAVGHPCIRVFILPQDLTVPNPDNDTKAAFPTLNEDFFKSLGSETAAAGKTADQLNLQKVGVFFAAYGIPETQWAQMNLDWLLTPGTVIPACPEAAQPQPRVVRPATLPGRGAAAPAARMIRTQHQPQAAAAGGAAGNVVGADFVAYGYPRARKHRKYTFIEPLGGVREAVDLAYLKEKGVVDVRFNVTNPDDYLRTISLGTRLTVPGGEKDIGIRVGKFDEEFAPGQKRTIRVEVGPGVKTGGGPGEGGGPGPGGGPGSGPGPGHGPNPPPEMGWDVLLGILILIVLMLALLIVLSVMILQKLK